MDSHAKTGSCSGKLQDEWQSQSRMTVLTMMDHEVCHFKQSFI